MKQSIPFGIFVLFVFFPSHAFAQNTARPVGASVDRPDVDFIISALESAATSTADLLVKSDVYIAVTDFSNPAESKSKSAEQTYAVMGEKVFMQRVKFQKGKTVSTHLESYDGETSKSYFPGSNEGRINAGMPDMFKTTSVPVPWAIQVWNEELLLRLREDDVSVNDEPVVQDGRPMWMLTGRAQEAEEYLEYRIWFDPSNGFMPRVIEEYRLGKYAELTRRVHLLSYIEAAEGIWIPRQIREEGHQNGEIFARNVYETIAIHVNDGVVSEDLFKIDFPPETEVYDESLGGVRTSTDTERLVEGLGSDSEVEDAIKMNMLEPTAVGAGLGDGSSVETPKSDDAIARRWLGGIVVFSGTAAICVILGLILRRTHFGRQR
ncbi:MAG: hypothetical protein ACOX5J_01350 [Candidatus Hydrogenedentales bacterium]